MATAEKRKGDWRVRVQNTSEGLHLPSKPRIESNAWQRKIGRQKRYLSVVNRFSSIKNKPIDEIDGLIQIAIFPVGHMPIGTFS